MQGRERMRNGKDESRSPSGMTSNKGRFLWDDRQERQRSTGNEAKEQDEATATGRGEIRAFSQGEGRGSWLT